MCLSVSTPSVLQIRICMCLSVLVSKNAMVSVTDCRVVTFFTKQHFEGSLIKMSYFGHIIYILYTRPNFRKSNTLRHFEVEAVRERFLKELVMLNPFLGSAKVKKIKNAYFVWYPKILNMADKIL